MLHYLASTVKLPNAVLNFKHVLFCLCVVTVLGAQCQTAVCKLVLPVFLSMYSYPPGIVQAVKVVDFAQKSSVCTPECDLCERRRAKQQEEWEARQEERKARQAEMAGEPFDKEVSLVPSSVETGSTSITLRQCFFKHTLIWLCAI